MKALSLKQPYAELVVSGKKTIELRKWNTSHRGSFLIHASKTSDKEAMKQFGFSDLPRGGVVGQVSLIEVKHYKNKEEHSSDRKKHLANEAWGNYGFILESPKRLPFRPCKGKLNFWKCHKTLPSF